MSAFTYEEREGRKYLVYEKSEEDSLDILTLEMMSNNRIDGVVSSNHIQIDDKFYMKYDITGLKSLHEFLQGTVNREKILSVIESIIDAAMTADDYMLSLSSYVLNADYLYTDPSTRKVSMIVLPIVRDEIAIGVFLKKLLMDIQYDQTEDCSYVVGLINLFGGLESFSLAALKEQIGRFKKENISLAGASAVKSKIVEPMSSPRQVPVQEPQMVQWPQSERAEESRPIVISEEDRKKIVHDLKREHDIDILFSGEEEKQSKKEKRGFFFKKDKPEKPEKEKKTEKKSFWGKLGKKKAAEKDSDVESALGGFAIPGMDIPGQMRTNEGYEKESYLPNGRYPGQEIAIPAQRVAIKKQAVERQDFGKTEFIREEDDDDETYIIGADHSAAGPEYILYRRNTQESFRICEEIMRIGRSPSVTEICISGNKGIGRIHAILYLRNGQVFIEDNNSKNKTYVDGVQLEPGQSPRRIENGSRIRLGDEELEIHIQAGQ